MNTHEKKDAEPALGFSFQLNLDPHAQRQLVFQTHVPATIEDGALNEVLDKIARVSMRQKFWTELEELEDAIRDEERKLLNSRGRLADQVEVAKSAWESSERRGAFEEEKAPAQQRQAIQNIRADVLKSTEWILNQRKRVALLKEKLRSAVHLRSDSHLGDPDQQGPGFHEPGGSIPQ